MPISIVFDYKDIGLTRAKMMHLNKEHPRALAAAITRAGDMAFTRVVRQVAKQMGVKQTTLTTRSRGLRKRRATFGNLTYEIQAKGHYLPVSYFPPLMSGRAGASARPWGREQHFPRAFIATFRSGHTGIFIRTSERTATGKPRLKELWGPSVARELTREDRRPNAPQIFADTFEEVLPGRIAHEVQRVLAGIGVTNR
jgi:hypothetical protein